MFPNHLIHSEQARKNIPIKTPMVKIIRPPIGNDK